MVDSGTALGWTRRNAVVVIATALALASCAMVPPDVHYREYVDVRTLVTLFCMLAVVKALEEIELFSIAATRLISVFGTRRSVVLALVWITLVGSMFITNDMALIAFLPLAHIVLTTTGNERYIGFVFVMQTAAANLGGMITPFGSPQNLYLYSFFEIPLDEFLKIMALPFGVSVVVISAMSLLIKNDRLHPPEEAQGLSAGQAAVCLALLAVTILVVLRLLPLWTSVVVPIALVTTRPRVLKRVDYGLLTTFLMFFVFSANLSRIESVHDDLSRLLNGDVLLWSIAASQVISNVPTALLFGQFTTDYSQLLTGVNVGGVGTLVGSLASLIALAEYQKHHREHTWSYLRLFTVVNIGLLVLLTLVTHVAYDLRMVPGA